jgi:hypothetical protein
MLLYQINPGRVAAPHHQYLCWTLSVTLHCSMTEEVDHLCTHEQKHCTLFQRGRDSIRSDPDAETGAQRNCFFVTEDHGSWMIAAAS